LKGLGREAVLVFDGDAAGVQAALRSLPFFLAEGAPARVVLLPQGEDPDSFVRDKGAAAFMDLVDAAPLMMDFAIDRVVAQCDGTKNGRAEAVARMRPLLRAVSDPVERSLHVRDLARRLAVDEHAVQAALAGDDRPWRRSAAGETDRERRLLPTKVLDTLAVAVFDPAARERLMESGALRELVGGGWGLALVEAIESLDEVAGAAWPADLISRLADDGLRSVVASLEDREVREPDRLVEDLVVHGRQRQIKSELAELRQEMLEAQAAGDEEREAEAVARARLLQRQLNNPSEAHV